MSLSVPLLSPPPRIQEAVAVFQPGTVVEVIEQRGSYRGDLDWENHVLEKVASVRRTHRITSVAVVDLGHPDAWLVLQAST